jgi:para-nitrobenzyl esterase
LDTSGRRPIAGTTSGFVRGKFRAKKTLVDFSGIPYADPPDDQMRWSPPVEPEPWNFVRDCTKHSPMAWQRGEDHDFARSIIEGIGVGWLKRKLMLAVVKWTPRKESEDCLTVNVTAPTDAQNAPVMVWFHGGDHTDGSGNEALYRTGAFPSHGCVLVTVNYRLGLFGFFAHPDLGGEGTDSTGGNQGLLDQIASLRWVKRNIASFGGDPGNVTIFGGSAGGQAVLNLMATRGARGLFHKAISQSPRDSGLWLDRSREVLQFQSAEAAAIDFANLAVGQGSGQLSRLREMGAQDLMAMYRANPGIGRHFFPTIGAAELSQSAFSTFALGRQAPVPLICGHNADEGSVFTSSTHPAGSEYGHLPPESDGLLDGLGQVYTEQEIAEILAAYPGLEADEQQGVSDHLGDHLFGVQVEHITNAHAAAGHPTYRYHYRATPASPDQQIGAFHGSELPPLFDKPIPYVDPGPGFDSLGLEMRSRWIAFASTGSPDPEATNVSGSTSNSSAVDEIEASHTTEPSPNWPRYDGSEARYLVFDRPATGAAAAAVEDAVPLAGAVPLHRRFGTLLDEDGA